MMRKKEDTMMLTADTDVDIVNIESKERVFHKNYCCYLQGIIIRGDEKADRQIEGEQEEGKEHRQGTLISTSPYYRMSFIIFGLLCNDDNMTILRKYINVGRFYLQADIRYNFSQVLIVKRVSIGDQNLIHAKD